MWCIEKACKVSHHLVMTAVTASVELLVRQSPGPDGVSEPEEEDVFEHLNGGEERVELGALYLLPPDGHLAHGQLQHLAHLNMATVRFWTKVIVPQLCHVYQPSTSPHQKPIFQYEVS